MKYIKLISENILDDMKNIQKIDINLHNAINKFDKDKLAVMTSSILTKYYENEGIGVDNIIKQIICDSDGVSDNELILNAYITDGNTSKIISLLYYPKNRDNWRVLSEDGYENGLSDMLTIDLINLFESLVTNSHINNILNRNVMKKINEGFLDELNKYRTYLNSVDKYNILSINHSKIDIITKKSKDLEKYEELLMDMIEKIFDVMIENKVNHKVKLEGEIEPLYPQYPQSNVMKFCVDMKTFRLFEVEKADMYEFLIYDYRDDYLNLDITEMGVSRLVQLFDFFIQIPGVSSNINRNVMKRINENILTDIDNLLKKKEELNNMSKLFDKDKLYNMIKSILNNYYDNGEKGVNKIDFRIDASLIDIDLKIMSHYDMDKILFFSKFNNHWNVSTIFSNLAITDLEITDQINIFKKLVNNKYINTVLNGKIMKRINESGNKIMKRMNENKPAEFRMNTMQNFNHFNQDRMGAMQDFAPRVNSEINRMTGEIFDNEDEIEDENGEIIPTDIDKTLDMDSVGLTINGEDQFDTPGKNDFSGHYGMGNHNTPRPNKFDSKPQRGIVFRFADFKGTSNSPGSMTR